tara:strand:- start:15972 stop:17222 length:1251 start_codon:yes stop_codon:yes gene_type:complete
MAQTDYHARRILARKKAKARTKISAKDYINQKSLENTIISPLTQINLEEIAANIGLNCPTENPEVKRTPYDKPTTSEPLTNENKYTQPEKVEESYNATTQKPKVTPLPKRHNTRKRTKEAIRLDELGLEYDNLKTVEYPGDFVKDYNGKLTDRRSPRQKEIMEELVHIVRPFLYKIANKMIYGSGHRGYNRKLFVIRGLNLDADDMVQEGYSYLIKVLHKYKPTKSALTTFVANRFAAHIYRIGNQQAGLIRLPIYVVDDVKKILIGCKDRNEAIQKIKDEITVFRLPITYSMAKNIYYGLHNTYMNIDRPVDTNDAKGSKWSELYLPDKKKPNPELEASKKEIRRRLNQIIDSLNPQQAEVIRRRFGLENRVDGTLEDVAKDLHLSKARIGQIEQKAIKKLRHPAKVKKLKPLID